MDKQRYTKHYTEK